MHVRDALPTQRRQNVAYSIRCSKCPSAYVGQTGRQFIARMKEPQRVVRRQDDNSLLALHCLTPGRTFEWTRVSVVGNGSTKRTREFIEDEIQHRRVLTSA